MFYSRCAFVICMVSTMIVSLCSSNPNLPGYLIQLQINTV